MGHGVVTVWLEHLRIDLLVDAREVFVGTLGLVTFTVKEYWSLLRRMQWRLSSLAMKNGLQPPWPMGLGGTGPVQWTGQGVAEGAASRCYWSRWDPQVL